MVNSHPGWNSEYQASEHKPRVAWMIKKSSKLSYTVRSNIWNDSDASILDINTEQGVVRLVNIYNQNRKEGSKWCARRIPREVYRCQKLLILGDFNAKSKEWDSECSENSEGRRLLHTMISNKMTLLNERDQMTWKRVVNREVRESVLDLAWASEELYPLCNWQIMENSGAGSDHAAIGIDVRLEAQRIPDPLRHRLTLKEVNWEKFREDLQAKVDQTEAQWSTNAELGNVDSMASTLERLVKESVEIHGKKSKITWKSKAWFDTQVKEKRAEVARKDRWRKRVEMREESSGEWMNRCKRWKAERNEYFRLIRRKKKEAWGKFINESKGKEMWRVWKCVNKRKTVHTPGIVTGKGVCTTFEEKEKAFYEAFFPEEEESQSQKEPASEAILVDPEPEEIRKAVCRQPSNKAPGPDGINSKVWKEAWPVVGRKVEELALKSLRSGRHPREWKKADVAVIPKADKGNYTVTKAYRPISLLSVLGKGVEKLAMNRLSKIGEEKAYNKHQWGGREKRSAEDCVLTTLAWCENKKQEGKKVILVATDVAQAFPNTPKRVLGNRLREKKVPECLVEWVEDFMSDRQVRIKVDDQTGEWREARTGIPQGSPVSPTLFNLHIAALLDYLEEYIELEYPNSAITPTFIDDLTYAISAVSWERAIEIAEDLTQKAAEWGESRGVLFEKEKTEWIRLGCRETVGSRGGLSIEGGEEIEEKKCIRWLGVWIDRQLNFQEHINIKIAKSKKAAWNVLGLVKGGVGVGDLRQMYVACARQVMEYASRVWWKGQKSIADKLDQEATRAMRKIGGHFSTAPSKAVQIENDLIPAKYRLDHRKRLGAIKAMQLPPSDLRRKATSVITKKKRRREEEEEWKRRRRKEVRDRAVGIERETRDLEKDLGLRGKKIEKWKRIFRKELNWEKKTRKEIEIDIRKDSDEERKRQMERTEERNEIVVYSDASKCDEGVGAAVVRIDLEGRVIRSELVGLGKEMEIGDAEMVGIERAVAMGVQLARKTKRKVVTVRTDSQYAIQRTTTREPVKGEMMAEKIRWEADIARVEGIKIRLEWVKAHIGTQGNTLADSKAKQAAQMPPGKHAFTSFAYLEKASRDKASKDWDVEYREARRKGLKGVGTQYTNFPATRHRARFPSDEREARTITTRLRTGHIDCAEYLCKIGKSETTQCECGAQLESVKHAILECPFTETRRNIVKRSLDIQDRQLELDDILYPADAKDWTLGALMWREFKRKRRRAREGRGEREERNEGENEEGWGWGDLWEDIEV